MEEPSASGRYIASLQHAIDTKLAVEALQPRFPGYKLPKGKQGEREQIIDNSKVGFLSDITCLWHSGSLMGAFAACSHLWRWEQVISRSRVVLSLNFCPVRLVLKYGMG